jgi:hypothetical protein
MSFTGLPLIFDSSVASMMKSGAKRRPKPPPSIIVLIFTFAGVTEASWPKMPCTGPWLCVPAQISTSSPLTHAVQFIGSMHACAR